MNDYLPALAYLGLWLLVGASLVLLRRVLAGRSPKRPSTAGPGGPDIESRGSWRPLALLVPVLSGAVLLLVLGAAGTGLEPSGAGLLPALLLVLVLAVALVHVRRGALPDAPDPQ